MRNEIIIEKDRDRTFIPITQYMKQTGLSYATVNHMCNTGQIAFITTESGHRKIDTRGGGVDATKLLDKLEKTEKMLSALCKQFNIAY